MNADVQRRGGEGRGRGEKVEGRGERERERQTHRHTGHSLCLNVIFCAMLYRSLDRKQNITQKSSHVDKYHS